MEQERMENQKLQTKDYLNNSKRELTQLLNIQAQGGKLISGSQLTLKKVFEVQGASVGVMRKNGMEKEIAGFYLLALKELWTLCENYFTKDSITDTAFLLMNEYPELRPQEIILILKNGLAGKYGRTYGKVTCQEVMIWTLQYFNERTIFFENNAIEKKGKHTSMELPNVLIEASKKILSEEKPKEKYIAEPENTNNKLIQGFMREFDKIYLSQGRNDGAQRFINIDGEELTVEDFLKKRIEEFNSWGNKQ